MLKFFAILVVCYSITSTLNAQNTDTGDTTYYSEIPDYPEVYSAGTVAARMVDGLGFRFYWATNELRTEDLEYRPGNEARSTDETIHHIYVMSIMIANAVQKEENAPSEGLSFNQKRSAILANLKAVSDILRNSTDEDLNTYVVKFNNGATLPFWNLINGPIADAIWHCGQIASFRRSSGNPFDANVSLLNGRLRK